MRKIVTIVASLSILGALPALAGWEEGVAAFIAKDFQQATTEFQEVVKQNPDGWRGHYMLGLCLEQLDREEKALHHLRKAYDLNPNDLSVKMALGRVYYDLERQGDSAKLRGGVVPGPKVDVQELRTGSRQRPGEPAKAVDDLDSLVQFRPDDWRDQFYLGQAYTSLGRFAEAERVLRVASELAKSPGDLRVVRRHLAFTYEKQKKYRQAIEAYGLAGDQQAVARVRESEQTERFNKEVEEENKQIEEMEEEANKLEEELKALEGGGGG